MSPGCLFYVIGECGVLFLLIHFSAANTGLHLRPETALFTENEKRVLVNDNLIEPSNSCFKNPCKLRS